MEKCASAFDDKGAGNTVSKLAMQEDILSWYFDAKCFFSSKGFQQHGEIPQEGLHF